MIIAIHSSSSALTLPLVIAALLLTTSFVSASPNDLYYAGVDDSWGRTSENDHAVVHAPGTPTHGIANRVSFGGEIGDGGRFLDSRLAQRAGSMRVHAAELAAPVTGRADIIFPGAVSAAAWFGEWTDFDQDGIITDIHDSLSDATDEFVWRGKSSSVAVTMPLYVHPSPQRAVELYAHGAPATRPTAYYVDGTDTDEQHWVETGGSSWAVTPGMTDASVLMTVQFITVADAVRDQSSPAGFDLTDPAALIDVDRYEALSPDVESLYLSAANAVKPFVDAARGSPGVSTAALIAEATTATGAFTDDRRREANHEARPSWPREPNHVNDDYGGNAFFGGVGDVAGSLNTYDGYADARHLYVDAVAKITWHPTVDADVRPLNVHVNPPVIGADLSTDADPTPGTTARPHDRHPTLVFGLEARIRAWQDSNRDGFVGTMCDPNDPAQWDGERNTCRNADSGAGWLETDSGDRRTNLCRESVVESAIVTPIGGTWPGVLVIRDHERYSSVAWDRDWEVRANDAEPIFLEWRSCVSSETVLSRDLLVFPAGSPLVPIETSVMVTSDPWRDTDGIVHASETVTDVDVYYPTL